MVYRGRGHQGKFDSATGDNLIDIIFILKSIIQLLSKSILIQLQQNISKLLKIYYNNTLDKELEMSENYLDKNIKFTYANRSSKGGLCSRFTHRYSCYYISI